MSGRSGRGVKTAAFIIATVALGLAASYGIALAGEPSSRWLWGDVLGLL